ncbi:hypothetical protein [Segatella copri]|uniref:hypothetical protein n=1 Tax=Segatella copri TaxID=165179 RepID=UPI000E4E5067|nr:hypothetical protein [Segatella copri]
MKIRKFLFVAIVICHVFCSCSSSTDTVIEDNVDKEQAHFEGVFNANSVIVHPGTNNWYGIDISRANTFWSYAHAEHTKIERWQQYVTTSSQL